MTAIDVAANGIVSGAKENLNDVTYTYDQKSNCHGDSPYNARRCAKDVNLGPGSPSRLGRYNPACPQRMAVLD